ncbi:DUF2934 domain-containing protein [Bradyrhizobium jicamae]|uniref:DUF2934 domain-containing protein n=1 Tax=Bradyrhizobium jicamae TaxID=280332 RepID=A0ABS5FQG4_9BRAD|nr:DUF2934 domain-containing protein [Bradyrhizobium jicamae]MBR0799042.1 DUF2934 domain-containing protein [Bradyrhizobium jicamae]MBR0936905.1 DUF2934 domain-containing protein [Bradyrhizobium jicamae]
MHALTEQDIRTRAYELWRAAGGPNIKLDAFWYRAEKELLRERAREERGSHASNGAPRRTVRRRRDTTPTDIH